MRVLCVHAAGLPRMRPALRRWLRSPMPAWHGMIAMIFNPIQDNAGFALKWRTKGTVMFVFSIGVIR